MQIEDEASISQAFKSFDSGRIEDFIHFMYENSSQAYKLSNRLEDHRHETTQLAIIGYGKDNGVKDPLL